MKMLQTSIQSSTFRSIVENTREAIAVIAPDDTIVYINRACEELFQISFEELTDAGYAGLFPDEELKIFSEQVRPSMLAGKGWSGELEAVTARGRKLWIWVNIDPILDDEGEVLHTFAFIHDISGRKTIEEWLQESEERYRTLFEFISSGVVILEPIEKGNDFIFKDINQAGQFLDMVKKDDIIGRRLTEVFPWVLENGLLETIQRVLRFSEPAHFPVSIYEEGENLGWREHWIYKLPGGEIVLLYEDIKEWRRIEEKLRKSESRNHALLEAVPDMIFRCNDRGVTVDFKPGRGIFTNMAPDMFVGKYVGDVLPQSAAEYVMQTVREVLADGSMRTIEYSLPIDGKNRYFEGRATSAGGNEVVFCVRDISERKRMEADMAEKESRFRTIVEALPIGYSEVDLNMNVTYANAAACRITGYTQADVQSGLNVRNMLTEKKKVAKNFKLTLQGKRRFPTRYTLKKKGGEMISVLLKSSPITEQGVARGVRNIIIDISHLPEGPEC